MAFTRISKFGGDSLPSEYLCASTDVKETEEQIDGEIIPVVEGSDLWEYDTQTAYKFVGGEWRTYLLHTQSQNPEHNHDLDYAAIDHDHDADYATIDHNHDADYANIVHNHESLNNVNFIEFDVSPEVAPTNIGSMYWDPQEETIAVKLRTDVTLGVGTEMYTKAVNKSGGPLLNGTVVYVSGAQGNRPKIDKAVNTAIAISMRTIGILTHDGPLNEEVFVTTHGEVHGLNTETYTEGDVLYLSDVAGEMTNVKPADGKARIRIGMVLVAHQNQGVVCVNVREEKYMFGDPDNGNYSYFEADGTLVAVGLARYTLDEFGDTLSVKTQGPGVSLNVAENTYDYVANSDLNDYLFKSTQFNHDRDIAAGVKIHVHFWQRSANVPNFLIQKRWQINGGAEETAWTNLKSNTAVHTYVSGALHQICTTVADLMPPVGTQPSDILQLRLIRDTANTSGEFAGADPINAVVNVMAFDVHKNCNKIGSRTPYAD